MLKLFNSSCQQISTDIISVGNEEEKTDTVDGFARTEISLDDTEMPSDAVGDVSADNKSVADTEQIIKNEETGTADTKEVIAQETPESKLLIEEKATVDKTIDECFIEFANDMVDVKGSGSLILKENIVNDMHRRYGIEKTSIIPSDYCYNRVNTDVRWDNKPALFEWFWGTSFFKVLGEGYPYNGSIYGHKKDGGLVKVGVCKNGVRQFFTDNISPAESIKTVSEPNIAYEQIFSKYDEPSEVPGESVAEREEKKFELDKSSVSEIDVQENWIRFDFINSDSFKGTVPAYCSFKNHQIEGRSWSRILAGIVEMELANKNPALEIFYEQSLTGKTKDYPFFLKDKIDGLNCFELSNGYWINVNHNIPYVMKMIKAFCLHCGYQKEEIIIFGVPKRNDYYGLLEGDGKNTPTENIGRINDYSKRIPWDEDEVILLLDTFLNITDSKIKRTEATKNLSDLLRKRAKLLGKDIDNTFRNENGIVFQLYNIAYILSNGKKGLPCGTKIFRNVVDLYKSNRDLYNRKLQKIKDFLNLEKREEYEYPETEENTQNKTVREMERGWGNLITRVIADADVKNVLLNHFPRGFNANKLFTSCLKFKECYEEVYNEALNLSNEDIEDAVSNSTICHGGIYYLPQQLLSEEDKISLKDYIDNYFQNGHKVLFYGILSREFGDKFIFDIRDDIKLLKKYVEFIFRGEYFFDKYFFSVGFQNVDIHQLVMDYLKEQNRIIGISEVREEFYYLAEHQINVALGDPHCIRNSKGQIFYVDYFAIDESGIARIAEIIDRNIRKYDLISGNKLYEEIKKEYPDILENNPEVTYLGLRQVLQYYLRDKFSFSGNYITFWGRKVHAKDIFSRYAKEHESFNLRELEELGEEINSQIILTEVQNVAFRISKNKFAKTLPNDLDICAFDEELSKFVQGDYLPLQDIIIFAGMPNVGLPWNSFLLQSCVYLLSDKYQLLPVKFSVSKPLGAIVRQGVGIDTEDDLLIRVLADSGTELERGAALDYLFNKGYLASRALNNIEIILLKAREMRNRIQKKILFHNFYKRRNGYIKLL